MINEVKIKWVDTEETEWVNIAEYEWHDGMIDDDAIFFYGLKREDLEEAMESHKAISGEWYVVEMGA